MIFLVWLLINIAANVAEGRILPLDSRYDWRNLDRASKSVILLWYSVPFSWWLDQRDSSVAQFGAGFVILVLGAALLTAAKRSNPHFQPKIVTPPEVIRHGVYRWLNHPGYHAMVMMGAASCLMLGHVVGWFLLAAYALILMLRAQEEDRLIALSFQDTGQYIASPPCHRKDCPSRPSTPIRRRTIGT